MPKQETKKEQIIFAAMTLFAKKGFARTSMADIASQAGIGKGTTYEYFKNKDQLFFETFEWFVKYSEQNAGLSVDTLAPRSAAEKIRIFSRSILNSLQESEELYPLVLEFWAATASSNHRDKIKDIFTLLYQRLGDSLCAIIKEGVANNEFDPGMDIDAIVPAIIGAWDTIGLQAWFYGSKNDGFDMEKTMTAFTELIINGFLKR